MYSSFRKVKRKKPYDSRFLVTEGCTGYSQEKVLFTDDVKKLAEMMNDKLESLCHICDKREGIRVIIFDSFVQGRASSYICESCLEKIQK